jgi:uncharacterized protein YcaQ
MAEVVERGPLRAADLRDPGERIGSWGTSSAGKAALDYHHLRGDLAIAMRDRRMGVWYDLVDRVIPRRWLQAEVPAPRDAAKALLLRAARRIGLGTVGDIADHHRQRIPLARPLLAELAAEGALAEVTVEGWRGPVYADPDLTIPRKVGAAALVNPFDPLVWNRDRTRRLFGMDYRIEIYVPADQRRYGYYALPFLLGDDLVARIDLKLDRTGGRLLVRQTTLEPDHRPGHVAGPLATELRTWAGWLGAVDIVVERDGQLDVALRRVVA